MNKKFDFIIKIAIIVVSLFLLTNFIFFDSKIKEWKGELVGNQFQISVYDNSGLNTLNISGKKVQVDGNVVKTKSVTSAGLFNTNYELSSAISMTIDGHNMEQTGNTVVFAEKGLKELKNFDLPQNISTKGGTFNLLDRNINKIKNVLGTSKIIVISSQLGVPIKVYGGEKVYWSIPDDLPKMTKINIDGKALYVHRANYVILDTEMLK